MLTGHAVTDKRLAKRIAHEVSRKLESEHNRQARRIVFGAVTHHTLGELCERYHRAKDWTPHHRKAQERFRDFWLLKLGEQARLTDVTDAEVDELAKTYEAGPETRRKLVMYIRGAYRYASRKLKWIGRGSELTAVDLPKGAPETDAYSEAEIPKLLAGLEKVGPEAAWMGHVAWQTGRRPTAIRLLKKADVTIGETFSVLAFPPETDKIRTPARVPVVGRAHELTVALMDGPGDYMLGPEPPTEETSLRAWLRAGEKHAGILHVKGRGWYGVKRAYATATDSEEAADLMAGVDRTTLRRTYRKHDMRKKLAVAQKQSVASFVTIEENEASEEPEEA